MAGEMQNLSHRLCDIQGDHGGQGLQCGYGGCHTVQPIQPVIPFPVLHPP